MLRTRRGLWPSAGALALALGACATAPVRRGPEEPAAPSASAQPASRRAPPAPAPPAPEQTPPPPADVAQWRTFEGEDGQVGYKDTRGKVVIAPRWLMGQGFSAAGIAHVADREGWLVINHRGEPLLRAFLWDNGPDPFSDGLARFVDGDGKVGFYDERGNVVIPAMFDFASPFSAGTARVCSGCKPVRKGEHVTMSGGTWQRIDRAGEPTER